MANLKIKEIRKRNTSFRMYLIVCIFVFLNFPCVLGFFGEWGPDLDGPWCANRPPGQDCCTGRDDYCAVPILGTECYCDIFCNDTAYDCCPDYWKHCHGFRVPTTTERPTTLPPPRPTRDVLAPCTRNGVVFRAGDTTYDNCNNCTCDLYQLPIRRYDWRCTQNICLLRPELIEAVNNDPNYIWTARNYTKLWGLTLDEGIRHRLGTFQLSDNVVDMTPIRVEDDVIPESFDARTKWPNLLYPISDQGNCASSWAHSSVAVASDRLSIETDGAIKDRLSVQHLLSCDIDGQLGCNGGHLDRAWWFLRQKGVVSEDCYPYTSGQTSVQGKCLIPGSQSNERCPSGIDYNTEKRYQATPPYRIRPLEREIMNEIMDNGPVQAIMQVREDFFMYHTGIYKYTGLTSLRRDSEEHMKSGFHSVRIVGWGAERTLKGDIIKFWICANSWGSDWGEDGYFRIIRGSDESSIESYVIGVWGKVTGDPALRVLLNENRRRRLKVERARKRRHLRHLRSHRDHQRRRNRRHHTKEEYKDAKTNKTIPPNNKQIQTFSNDMQVDRHEQEEKYSKKQDKLMKQTKKKIQLGQNKLSKQHNKQKMNSKHTRQQDTNSNHQDIQEDKHSSPETNLNMIYKKQIQDKIIYDFSDSMSP